MPGQGETGDFYAPRNGVLTRMPLLRRHQLIGEIVTLLLASPMHRRYLINDIGAVFLPPLHLNQFRIYRNRDKRVVGLVTWAWLTAEVEKAYVEGDHNLKPTDWNAGKLGWVIDFVAPFGHAGMIIKDLRSNIFADKVGKAIRVGADGKVKGILKLHGVRAAQQARDMKIDLTLPSQVLRHHRRRPAAPAAAAKTPPTGQQ